MRIFLFFTLMVFAMGETSNPSGDVHPLSDEFINIINSKNSTWRAGRNFHQDFPMSYFTKSMEVAGRNFTGYFKKSMEVFSKKYELPLTTWQEEKIPDSFDAREQWPSCPTIKEIRDQGSCGNWAVAATEMISDRICIHSDGKKIVHISAEDVLSCCAFCGSCSSGDVEVALDYWVETGIVTGGPYGSNKGCRPYEIPPCEHFVNGSRPPCSKNPSDIPPCKKECIPDYETPYSQDKHYGNSWYVIMQHPSQMLLAMHLEILKHGPLISLMYVSEDFFHYKSGVYQHVHGHGKYFQYIKILGWGVENGTPYWLCANSWNSDWGDNGFVKILRGKDESDIEFTVFGGIPRF